LNQITADERAASRSAQELATAATPNRGTSRCLFPEFPRRLHAGFEADEILILPQTLVDRDKKIIRARFLFQEFPAAPFLCTVLVSPINLCDRREIFC